MTRGSAALRGIARVLPGAETVRLYRRGWLRGDLAAGIAVGALLIPAGLGYAEVAGLPPVTGLYATIIPILVYAVLGPSRILVLGPDSALAPIIAAAVIPLAIDSERRVDLAGVLAIEVGVVLVLAAVLRLGFVTSLLAKPIRIGYLNGIALVVVLGQIPALLGYSGNGDSIIEVLTTDLRGVIDGRAQPKAVVIGLVCLVVIVALKWWKRTIPGVLVAVAGSMLFVWAIGWEDTVPVVGAMPDGLPAPAVPSASWDDWVSLMLPAVGIALIAFADTSVLSRTFAARAGHSVDGNHEMGAVGASNVAAGFFGGFPISASSSRTAVAEQSGAKTQLTALIGAALLILALVLVPGLTEYLPSAALAAVVITAALALVDVRSVVELFRIDFVEGAISVVAFGGVAILGVMEGILVAIGLAFVAFIYAVSRPYRAELGWVPGLRGYHDRARHPEAELTPHVLLLRFDAPLFFANGARFDDWVRDEYRSARSAGREITAVVLACEPITHIDSTAIDELVELDDYLSKHSVDLAFAEMKDPIREQLERYRLKVDGKPRFGSSQFAPTVDAMVDRFDDRPA
ncbi:SulP family inorganic anion transporter [Gordonia alkaliphila]|uniref:SulP family inorganic anion transporter n=1 Tax=Gordonia alkaliphila TaxID=1053547 RepID=UPI001FF4BBBC|nr:SulP family inorganic anion transporter [Gordonia alkaliphila]MCK0439536.1 SulP family inorganic anion transporter [Gordonia alkaliphila]